MKKIAIISGKGGTGKTFLTGALTAIPKHQVIIDCDVDASNLYLMLEPSDGEGREFYGGKVAEIDSDLCIECGICRDKCRYDAILPGYTVDPYLCEGCSLCMHLCPVDAVEMVKEKAGYAYQAETSFGPFSYAEMTPGSENSGKLVAELKRTAKKTGEETGADFMLLDGPPGTGCPLISTVAGCHAAIIVTEPTQSGMHDLGRVYDVLKKFRTAVGVVINKYDLSLEESKDIEALCEHLDIPVIGKIPYSTVIAEKISRGDCTSMEFNGVLREEIERIWAGILRLVE
ncbi:MAG: ATP-binding protein [Candidatus Marinimicrobia bacterium]|nr:ATP-binding protein [Candidatus Neomarinimicrobiota bacterium]MCF7827569.1 ATP-binding protein [Candidatus Neomarinimicrobiota bacterium]MCF7881569.1 ATP-binding protein [Candidatus Neomarinimicrobiota bacterium]